MDPDLRGTAAYVAVTEHITRLHAPAFGHPHALIEPHATSDGGEVVVTGLVLDELVGLPRKAVYLAHDGELQAVSSVPGSSACCPQFSPDGSSLAFLSDRRVSGALQLFLLARDRLGEAVAAPEAPGTVEYVRWSPDGRWVLLGVAGSGADVAGAQGSGTVGAYGQTAEAWQPVTESGLDEADAWRSLWTYSVATGELTRLSPEGMNCWEAAWCGPGQVVVVASDDPSEDSWYDATLQLLLLDGGPDGADARELLRSAVQLGLPAGSPDGRHVAIVEAVCSDRGIVAGDVTLIDLATGERARVDTAGTDVTWLQWLDDGQLGYAGQRRLDSVAGIVDLASRQTREVLVTDRSCGPRYPVAAFTTDGRVLTVQDSYAVPPQVVLADGQDHRVLATAGHAGTDYLSSVAGTARALTWSAPDGLEIDGLLCEPSGDGPFPLVVNIHGGPIWAFQDSWSMASPWVPLLVSRGYAVLSPNPRGSGGRGQDFAGRVVGDMGGADTHDYLAGIDALVDQGVADPDRIGLIGGSYGGFMSSWLVTQDQRFAAAVPIAPVTNWYSQTLTSNISRWGLSFLDTQDLAAPGTKAHTRSPALQAGRVRTPCLNVAGALDRCTPPGQAREFHRALRSQGVDSELVIYPQEGHGVRALPAQIDFLARVLTWFERYLSAQH